MTPQSKGKPLLSSLERVYHQLPVCYYRATAHPTLNIQSKDAHYTAAGLITTDRTIAPRVGPRHLPSPDPMP